MAIYPASVVRLLPQSATQSRITPRKIVHHTAVDGTNTTTLFDWFNSPGAQGCESHFYVRQDGTVEQYMDTNTRADAQWDANVDAISIETWDGRASSGGPAIPWTDPQLQALIALDRWLCDTHPTIDRVLCPSATGSGLGWHNQYFEWAKDGHDCPGQPRIDQLVGTIIPALTMTPAPPAPTEEDDMSDLFLIRGDATPSVWAVTPNFTRAFHIPTPAQVPDLRYALSLTGHKFLDPPPGAKTDALNGSKVWVAGQAFVNMIPKA